MSSKIVLLGPINPVTVGFSGQAYIKLAKAFGAPKVREDEKNVVPVEKNEHILDTMLRHEKSYGVIAMETSTSGRITKNVESFIRSFGRWNNPSDPNIMIIGGIKLLVRFVLIGTHPAASIKEIIAHGEALAACEKSILRIEHDQGSFIKRTGATSNAKAAEMVAEKKQHGVFALASVEAAKKYGLYVCGDLYERKKKFTTFFLLGPQTHREMKGKSYRVLIIFPLPNVPSALHRALGPFSQESINIIEIHSMPVGNGRYDFAIEAECAVEDLAYMDNAIRKFKAGVPRSIVFGPFPVIEG